MVPREHLVVSLRRVKSPETLFSEVSEFDRVVVPDPALGSALTRHLREPHYGPFASTPRRLAAGGRETGEDRHAFLAIMEHVDATWPELADTVGNVLQCWEHTGTIEGILDFDHYRNETTRAVVEQLREATTTSRQMQNYHFDSTDSVAVIGGEGFTALEQQMIPDTAVEIDLFAATTAPTPHVARFSSDTAIIQTVIDQIASENGDEIAIVVPKGSKLAILLEAHLEANDRPYVGGPGFIDEQAHRLFIQLLYAGYRGNELRLSDVLPLLTFLGFEVPIKDHYKRVAAVSTPGTRWLQETVTDLSETTFAYLLTEYENALGRTLTRFRQELQTLGIASRRITSDRVQNLEYYLQRYEIPIDRENEGVLLVDATSSSFVDRPTVLFLGLDEEWVQHPPERPWIDTKEQYDRHKTRFERLLQSGENQYYLVTDSRGGEPVRPCSYFHDCLDSPPETFAAFPNDTYVGPATPAATGFSKPAIECARTTIETISQSSLNQYVNCPQDYFYDCLLSSPDQSVLVRGSIFHDFAEFYVEHPSVIQSASTEELLDICLAEERPFIVERDAPLARRTYGVGMHVIQSYLDANEPDRTQDIPPTDTYGENVFAAYFGESIDSGITEHLFRDNALGISGLIDLIHTPTHLVDYKSGRKKRPRTLVRRGTVTPLPETPNFQASLYLAYYRERMPEKHLRFSFFHFLEPMNEAIDGRYTIDDACCTIPYEPRSFSAFVSSYDAYDALLDGYTDCRETFDDLGWRAYESIMEELEFPEMAAIDKLRETPFFVEFTDAVRVRTTDDVDAAKGCDQAVRALNTIRATRFFEEDIDALCAFVTDTLTEINDRRTDGTIFPVEGPAGEPNYRRVSHRDLLLSGEQQ